MTALEFRSEHKRQTEDVSLRVLAAKEKACSPGTPEGRGRGSTIQKGSGSLLGIGGLHGQGEHWAHPRTPLPVLSS